MITRNADAQENLMMSNYNKVNHAPKVTAKGTILPLIDLKGKPYLQVAHRLVWFREEWPTAEIKTEVLKLENNYAVVKAQVVLNNKVLGSGHKKETEDNFPDFIEKAETGAIGRALAMAGFGTQFEPDLDEGMRLADAPVELPKRSVEEKVVDQEVVLPSVPQVIEAATNVDKLLKLQELAKHYVRIGEKTQKLTIPEFKQVMLNKYGTDKFKEMGSASLLSIIEDLKGLVG